MVPPGWRNDSKGSHGDPETNSVRYSDKVNVKPLTSSADVANNGPNHELARKLAVYPDPDSRTLFVGNIPKAMSEDDVKKVFAVHGNIYSIFLVYDVQLERQGGFITFYRREAAGNALYFLDGFRGLPGMERPLQVRVAERELKPGRTLYVGHLSEETKGNNLFSMFCIFGPIARCQVLTGEHKYSGCYGFVAFKQDADAKHALRSMDRSIKMDGLSQPIVVRLAHERKKKLRAVNGPTVEVAYLDHRKLPHRLQLASPGMRIMPYQPPSNVQNASDGSAANTSGLRPGGNSLFKHEPPKVTGEPRCLRNRAVTRTTPTTSNFLENRWKQQQLRDNIGTSLFVSCLPRNVKDDGLKQMFEPYGRVLDVEVVTNKYTGLSCRYGFVTYVDVASARRAILALNGMDLPGERMPLKVEMKRSS